MFYPSIFFLAIVLIVHVNIIYCTVWHPYDLNKKYDEICYEPVKHINSNTNADVIRNLLPKYSTWNSTPVSLEFMNKYKLWPDVISQFDMKHGQTMYGLEEAIEVIYKHQHPPDCSKAKFLISGMFESGFGSELHVIGVGLATAMNLNRVYIMYPNRKMESANKWQVDTPFCRKQGKHKLNLDCYYEPWTNCTIQDALGDRTVYQLITENGGYLHPNGYNKEVYDSKYFNEKAIVVELGPENDWDLPKPLETLIACSPFATNKYKYWWRSISVTYLMRLNEPTKQLIKHFKANESSSMYFDKENEQCISVYARRGDKHLEMKIVEDESIFFETARQLWNNLNPKLNPNQEKPIMFVASEDAHVIDSAITWGEANNWKILYTDLFDRKKVLAGYNTTQRQQIWDNAQPIKNHHLEYFSMVLNINSHIQCSAFICSMPSNFCRIIDELKATIAAKANTPLADFHDGSAIPCYSGSCTTIGW